MQSNVETVLHLAFTNWSANVQFISSLLYHRDEGDGHL